MRFVYNLLTLLAIAAAISVLIAAPWPVLLGSALLLAAWLLWTRVGRQATSVTGIGLRTLRQRAGASLVIIIGIGGVVAVLVALLAMAEGYSDTLRRSGSEDSAVVLRGGSSAEGAGDPGRAGRGARRGRQADRLGGTGGRGESADPEIAGPG